MIALVLLTVVHGLVIAFLTEVISRNGYGKTLRWVIGHPVDCALNTLLVMALDLLLTAAIGGLFIALCITTVLTMILALVSFFKRAARNEPLFLSDLFLAFKVMGVAGASNIVVTKAAVSSFVIAVFALAGVYFIPRMVLGVYERVIAGVVSALTLVILGIKREDDFMYVKKGFARGFFLNVLLYFSRLAEPGKIIEPQRTQRNTKKTIEKNKLEDQKPNVIVILSESFFDITRIKNLELDRDPLPVFHSLKDRAATGKLFVTPFGGGTCAVEAEFLTGAIAKFFNISKPFYYSSAKRPIPSLATHFIGQGYEARAVHTFSKTFYNRDQALKNMGFQSFIGAEDMPDAEKDGFYISDKTLTDYIIKTYNEKKAPSFIFGISMENHQPYAPDKYGKTEIKVLNKDLEDRLRKEAETYIHCLSHTDREIGRLAEFIDNCPEPTILLFFGDHLGAIGSELAFYKKMGYINEEGVNDTLNIYSPDFFIISNQEDLKGSYDYIGANYLGNILLDICGRNNSEKSELYETMDWAFKKARCLSRDDIFIDGAGRAVTELTREMKDAEDCLKNASFRAMNIRAKGRPNGKKA